MGVAHRRCRYPLCRLRTDSAGPDMHLPHATTSITLVKNGTIWMASQPLAVASTLSPAKFCSKSTTTLPLLVPIHTTSTVSHQKAQRPPNLGPERSYSLWHKARRRDPIGECLGFWRCKYLSFISTISTPLWSSFKLVSSFFSNWGVISGSWRHSEIQFNPEHTSPSTSVPVCLRAYESACLLLWRGPEVEPDTDFPWG